MVVVFVRDAGQLGESGEEAEEIDRLVTDGAGLGAGGESWSAVFWDPDHEGHASDGAPGGEFLPVLFLAEVPAVVTPKDDDGIVGIGSILEGIENAAKHGVGKMDGGKVALNGLLPLTFITNVSEVAVRTGLFTGGGKVVEIVFAVAGRELDFFEREGFEVFFWNEPRLVRSVESAGEKEGGFLFDGELLGNPFRDFGITAKFFISGIERAPVGFDVLPRATAGEGKGAFFWVKGEGKGVFRFLFREVFVPRFCVDEVVKHFSGAAGAIAMVAKMLGDNFCVGEDLAHLLSVVVESGAMRREPGHDGGAGGIARSTRAMGICEKDPAGSESIKVGGDRLGVPA